LRIAAQDRAIFSLESLAWRKSEILGLDVREYVRDAYAPTADDFRSFRREVKEWRRLYEANYRAVRNQIFAHVEVAQSGDVDALFAKTNIQELEVLVTNLVAFNSRLQELLQNGTRPDLKRWNSSVQAMRALPQAQRRATLHGRVIDDTERSLVLAAAAGDREVK
jgi:hypothetical protein